MTMREEFEAWVVKWDLQKLPHLRSDILFTWEAAYAAGQRANPWEQAIKDAMAVHWIEDEHWSDPQKAIAALLERAAQHVLDPQISEAAQALIAQGQRAEREAGQEGALMGECMTMVHEELVDLGVIDKAVPPMMVPQAVSLAMRAAVIREREACAVVCDGIAERSQDVANTQAEQAADECAAAIRNRKEQG